MFTSFMAVMYFHVYFDRMRSRGGVFPCLAPDLKWSDGLLVTLNQSDVREEGSS